MTISGHFYRRDAMEWEWVSVGPMIADDISTKVYQVMARKLMRRGNVVCFDCQMKIAFERIDAPDFDCSSRADLVRVMHESQ